MQSMLCLNPFSLAYKDHAFELFGDILPLAPSPSIVSENGKNIRNDIDSLQQFAQIVVERAAHLDLNFKESS